jgi:hypothetical protein
MLLFLAAMFLQFPTFAQNTMTEEFFISARSQRIDLWKITPAWG